MKLTQHFNLHEATYSAKAISLELDNQPNERELETIKITAAKMELVRKVLGNRPIIVTSWFRSPKLNQAVGGSPTSQHQRGEAVDFKCPRFGSPRAICLKLMQHREELGYDQIILEPTWVHISFTDGQPRRQELIYTGPGQYKKGIA